LERVPKKFTRRQLQRVPTPAPEKAGDRDGILAVFFAGREDGAPRQGPFRNPCGERNY